MVTSALTHSEDDKDDGQDEENETDDRAENHAQPGESCTTQGLCIRPQQR